MSTISYLSPVPLSDLGGPRWCSANLPQLVEEELVLGPLSLYLSYHLLESKNWRDTLLIFYTFWKPHPTAGARETSRMQPRFCRVRSAAGDNNLHPFWQQNPMGYTLETGGFPSSLWGGGWWPHPTFYKQMRRWSLPWLRHQLWFRSWLRSSGHKWSRVALKSAQMKGRRAASVVHHLNLGRGWGRGWRQLEDVSLTPIIQLLRNFSA